MPEGQRELFSLTGASPRDATQPPAKSSVEELLALDACEYVGEYVGAYVVGERVGDDVGEVVTVI